MKSIYDVIKRPVISEKSTAMTEVANRYTFEVARQATKPEIKDAIERLFSVKVEKVWTQLVHGKIKRSGRTLSKRPNWKKAIVAIGEGQAIDFFNTQQQKSAEQG